MMDTDTQDESDDQPEEKGNKVKGGRMGRMNTGRMKQVQKPSGRMSKLVIKGSAAKGTNHSSLAKDK